jgi:hypothetical protein
VEWLNRKAAKALQKEIDALDQLHQTPEKTLDSPAL